MKTRFHYVNLIAVIMLATLSACNTTFHETFDDEATVVSNGGTLGGTYLFEEGVIPFTKNALYLPSSASLSYPNEGKAAIDEGTISFWLKPDQLTGGALGIGTLSERNSFGIFIATHPSWGSKHLVLELRDSRNSYYQAWSHEIPVEPGEWFFATVSWDCDSVMRACVDGVCGYDKTINLCDYFTMNETIQVGRTGWYSDINATFDDMNFFSELKTPEQIEFLFNLY